jgi:hypothetical protein
MPSYNIVGQPIASTFTINAATTNNNPSAFIAAQDHQACSQCCKSVTCTGILVALLIVIIKAS